MAEKQQQLRPSWIKFSYTTFSSYSKLYSVADVNSSAPREKEKEQSTKINVKRVCDGNSRQHKTAKRLAPNERERTKK
jgi:hypothetical protein